MFPQANGYAHANLTLQDPACKATVNATHYTLETPLTGCQTTVYPMQGSPMALYINSVSTTPIIMLKQVMSIKLVYLNHKQWPPRL